MYGLMAIHVSLIAVKYRRTLLVTVQAASPESILPPVCANFHCHRLAVAATIGYTRFIDNIYNLL